MLKNINVKDDDLLFYYKNNKLECRYGKNIEEQAVDNVRFILEEEKTWFGFEITKDLPFLEELKNRDYNLDSFYFFISKNIDRRVTKKYEKEGRLIMSWRREYYDDSLELVAYGNKRDTNLIFSYLSDFDRELSLLHSLKDNFDFKWETIQFYLEKNKTK